MAPARGRSPLLEEEDTTWSVLDGGHVQQSPCLATAQQCMLELAAASRGRQQLAPFLVVPAPDASCLVDTE